MVAARIADPRIAMQCGEVFYFFEGAYRYSASAEEVIRLLKFMAELGNILGICDMIDSAFAMKSATTTHVGSFSLGKNPTVPDDGREREFFGLLDAQFKSGKDMIATFHSASSEDKALSLFLCRALLVLVQQIRENMELFNVIRLGCEGRSSTNRRDNDFAKHEGKLIG
jgi:hypothetical protein